MLEVDAKNVAYCDDFITSEYDYADTRVFKSPRGGYIARPRQRRFTIRTKRKIPKIGMMLVGLGGNNGTTITGGIIANREKLSWMTKEGRMEADYVGSITQSATMKIGIDEKGEEVYVPLKSVVPMVNPNDIHIGGWDISKMNLADGMKRASVFPQTLQDKLAKRMRHMVPLPSVYYKEYLAANQEDRADNVIPGNDKQKHLEHIRNDIRTFKRNNKLDKVIVLWTANTERMCKIIPGVHDSSANLLKAIKTSHPEISPSTLFATASILEGCTYINGSPQNTYVPGVVELATKHGVFIGGDDFKSGQARNNHRHIKKRKCSRSKSRCRNGKDYFCTLKIQEHHADDLTSLCLGYGNCLVSITATKMKSVMVDFLVSSGIKPVCIASYNHLGNNDGKNLSSAAQFRSKEISKSNVVDDMINSNRILYKKGEKPDHLVVIKYMPFVRDSKRALDEYTSKIFMGGLNTIVMHNTCEDSLLASPLIIDLVILAELCERISIKAPGEETFSRMDTVLSFLSFMIKAPLVPK
eukprot:jgi/Bigna1/126806/aug1.3_g1514